MWDDGFSSQSFNNQMGKAGMDANTKCREMYSLKSDGEPQSKENFKTIKALFLKKYF